MKLDKLKKETVAEQPAKIEATERDQAIKANDDIIADNTENVKKKESFNDILKKLSKNFMLGEVYLFLDL